MIPPAPAGQRQAPTLLMGQGFQVWSAVDAVVTAASRMEPVNRREAQVVG